MYIRQLSADTATNCIKKVESLGGRANYTAGGLHVEISDHKIFALKTWLNGTMDTYSFCNEHPTKVELKISQRIKYKHIHE